MMRSFPNAWYKVWLRVGGAASTFVTGTPAGLIGGDMVNELVQGGPKQSPLSTVTDADMLLLAKEVESLQSELLAAYYDYRHSRDRLTLAQQGQKEVARYQELLPTPATPTSPARYNDPSQAMWEPLAATITTGLNDTVVKTQQEYLSARQHLVMLVGADALTALESGSKEATTTSTPATPQTAATLP
ncbi:MAG: hypothetical protein U0003_03175 [Vampirovibrionales bacterium]